MLLARGDAGGPSTLCRVLQANCVLAGVLCVAVVPEGAAVAAGMSSPNVLLYLAAGVFGLAWAVPVTLAIGSTCLALGPGGALEKLQLSAAKARISVAAAQRLERRRRIMLALTGFWMALGLFFAVSGLAGLAPLYRPGGHPLFRAWLVSVGMGWVTVSPVVFSGWFASMYNGNFLCRDAINKQIENVSAGDPTEGDWLLLVAEPTLRLVDTVSELSRGWARGLLAQCALFWLAALAWFMLAVNQPVMDGCDEVAGAPPGFTRTFWLVLASFVAVVPLLIAEDLGATSEQCDKLMDQLNESRKSYGPTSSDRICWLESTLRNLNNGQGLGFVVGRHVVDSKNLRSLLAKIGGLAVTISTFIIAFADSVQTTSSAGRVCELSQVEEAGLRMLLLGWHGMANTSCTYNASVGPEGVIVH